MMTTGEAWFLVLICGAFASLALTLTIATVAYRRSLKPSSGQK